MRPIDIIHNHHMSAPAFRGVPLFVKTAATTSAPPSKWDTPFPNDDPQSRVVSFQAAGYAGLIASFFSSNICPTFTSFGRCQDDHAVVQEMSSRLCRYQHGVWLLWRGIYSTTLVERSCRHWIPTITLLEGKDAASSQIDWECYTEALWNVAQRRKPAKLVVGHNSCSTKRVITNSSNAFYKSLVSRQMANLNYMYHGRHQITTFSPCQIPLHIIEIRAKHMKRHSCTFTHKKARLQARTT